MSNPEVEPVYHELVIVAASPTTRVGHHGARNVMTRAERAQQLWSLLALAATSRHVLTYDMVARLTGVVRPSIGDFLRPIQQGFIAAADVPAAQARVFHHRWLDTNAPSAEQFEAAYSRAPDRR